MPRLKGELYVKGIISVIWCVDSSIVGCFAALYGIKIMKRQKSAVENFEFHEQFSSKEPHSILLFNVSWFAICFGLSFSIVANRKFYFSEVDFNIKAVVSLLLLIFGALYFVLKIFTHWHKKIEVNVVQLTYTDGIGREISFLHSK